MTDKERRRPRFCPGCGQSNFDRQYACRNDGLMTYCFECGTNWYIRDVGASGEAGMEFSLAEMEVAK